MKTILAILPFLLLGSFSSASVICATDHLTTTYALFDRENGYEFHIMHHNGIEFMPIHSGIITPSDIQILSENASILKKMGPRLVINFTKSECQGKDGEWFCVKQGKQTLGGLEVSSLSFRLNKKRVISKIFDYETWNVSFSVVNGNRSYSLPMEYSKDQCVSK